MAFTRKMLKAMGIEDEKIEQIIEAHAETVSALKDQIDEAKESAENLGKITKERDELLTKLEESGKTAEKYSKLKEEYEKYKTDVEGEKTAAAKQKAVKEYFESKNITGGNLDIALKGCKEEISAIVLNENGGISDTTALDSLISGMYAGLVSRTDTKGADVPNPPQNNPNVFSSLSLAEKMAYANSNPDSEEVKNWLKGE